MAKYERLSMLKISANPGVRFEISRMRLQESRLIFVIPLPSHRDDVAHDDGHIAVTTAQDDLVGFGRCFWKVAEVEFLFVSDLYDLEAFLYEVGGELPQLFKVAVAVEDSRKVLLWVVGGNSEVV